MWCLQPVLWCFNIILPKHFSMCFFFSSMFLDLKQTHCFQGLMWTVLLVLNFVFSWCLHPFQCQSSRQDPVDRKHVGQGQWDDHWRWNGLYLSQDHREDGGQWLSWRKRKCMLSLFRIHLSSSHLISQCSGLIRLFYGTRHNGENFQMGQ